MLIQWWCMNGKYCMWCEIYLRVQRLESIIHLLNYCFDNRLDLHTQTKQTHMHCNFLFIIIIVSAFSLSLVEQIYSQLVQRLGILLVKCTLCNIMRDVYHHLPAAAYRHRADPPEQRGAPTSKNPTSKNIHINHCKTDLYQFAAFSF